MVAHVNKAPETVKVKALVCPLDWGIGHATRCIPVIGMLQELGFEVIVAGSGRPLAFIKREFPGINCIDFPGQKIEYSQGKFLFIKLLSITPSFLLHICREHRKLARIVETLGIGLVISDNRYGCWHPEKPSIFITHQLNIQVPGILKIFSKPLNRLNYFFIHRYSDCWIPDFEPHHGLAGSLSHPQKTPVNSHYIGTLSRFSRIVNSDQTQYPPSLDLLVMLSGPEPQRSLFENIILKQLSGIDLQTALVRGIPDSKAAYSKEGNIHVFDHLETPKLYELMARASLVICRSGYSSIMDLVTVGKRAILVPTPGQTEQEYLSRYLRDKKIYFSMKQSEFDLLYAIELSVNFPGMVIRNDENELKERIVNIMSRYRISCFGPKKSV